MQDYAGISERSIGLINCLLCGLEQSCARLPSHVVCVCHWIPPMAQSLTGSRYITGSSPPPPLAPLKSLWFLWWLATWDWGQVPCTQSIKHASAYDPPSLYLEEGIRGNSELLPSLGSNRRNDLLAVYIKGIVVDGVHFGCMCHSGIPSRLQFTPIMYVTTPLHACSLSSLVSILLRGCGSIDQMTCASRPLYFPEPPF